MGVRSQHFLDAQLAHDYHEARCGRDGYRYIVAAEEPGLPESTWDDNGGNVEPDDSAALQAMAARMQADRPDLKTEINPPGRSKVSDMIALVAEPLLAEAPDYETKRGILMLAGLAWNFSLFDRSKQRALINDLAGLFPDAESAELFSYLAARATMLFPDEKRIICAIETDPEASGNFALRVSSAM